MKTNHKLSIMHTVLIVLCAAVLALHRALTDPVWQELVLVAAAALLVTVLAGMGVCRIRGKLQLKPAAVDKGSFGFLAGAGLLFLVSAVLAVPYMAGQLLEMVSVLFAAACGVATLARLKVRDKSELSAVFALVPVFYLCYYLLMFYRANGDNPYLSQFGYETAVIIAALLGLYGAAAGKFENDRPLLRSALCGGGLLLILQELLFIVLIPDVSDALASFTLSTAVLLLACALLLCNGLLYPPVREVFPVKEEAPAEDQPEEENG